MKTFRSHVPKFIDGSPTFIQYTSIEELLENEFFDVWKTRSEGAHFFVSGEEEDLLMCEYSDGKYWVVGYLNFIK